jgi:ParB family chromosome partitioning protein
MIQNISIDKLHPHPDNPRKDLGDLSELAESIKAQGILQNLTVVGQNKPYTNTESIIYMYDSVFVLVCPLV